MSHARKLAILRSVSLFAGLPETTLAEVAALLEERSFRPGEAIFAKGDHGTSLYVVADGLVRVHDGERTLNDLGPLDVFGEMAALDPEPRSASVTALESTRLYRLESSALHTLLAARPAITQAIIHILVERLRARLRDMAEDFKSIRDLQIARQIQASFLPTALPELPGWSLAAVFQPARQVGGDFYDVFTLGPRNLLGLVIADVCDKGVGAALYMALFRSLIRAFAEQQYTTAADALPAEQALGSVVHITNNYIARTHGHTNMFATLFVAVLDPATGGLFYVNGGHEPPVIVGEGRIKTTLKGTGPAVGMFPDLPYGVNAAQLAPGDALVAFTDGVTEARAPDRRQYTTPRLFELLSPTVDTAADLLARVETDLQSHIADAEQSDDITLLAVHRAAAPTAGPA